MALRARQDRTKIGSVGPDKPSCPRPRGAVEMGAESFAAVLSEGWAFGGRVARAVQRLCSQSRRLPAVRPMRKRSLITVVHSHRHRPWIAPFRMVLGGFNDRLALAIQMEDRHVRCRGHGGSICRARGDRTDIELLSFTKVSC